ncbi:sensor histidine kinase [Kineococcus sp. SYSU DK003]|uniref:sensor histidine kinase n=1 Tax=Kineococcus sp. SYSU DK003 TaxID=3383124 RepID=UPI003D7EB3B7
MRRLPGPSLVDPALAALLTLLTLGPLVRAGEPLPGLVLATLTAAPIAVRQRVPVVTAVLVLAAVTAHQLVLGAFPGSGLGMVVAMFTVATLRSRRTAAAVFAAAVVVVWLGGASGADPVPSWFDLAQAVLVLAGAWALGESTRRWAQRTEALAAESARAVAAERRRIARELHDVVGHHLSVTALQAGVAGYVFDDDPATAKTALATVEDTTREALAEMRRLLEVLRADDDPDADYLPQPGLAALPDLAERARSAGVAVDVRTDGTFDDLSAGQDLCAYRVVQESLTNVIKHTATAPHAVHAQVLVERRDGTLHVDVHDDGPAVLGPVREGHGLRGMRERAALYGGTLTAGPRDGRGFAVQLRLPVRGEQ